MKREAGQGRDDGDDDEQHSPVGEERVDRRADSEREHAVAEQVVLEGRLPRGTVRPRHDDHDERGDDDQVDGQKGHMSSFVVPFHGFHGIITIIAYFY